MYFIETTIKWLQELTPQCVTENKGATFSCQTCHEDLPVRWYLGKKQAYEIKGCTTLQKGRVHTLTINKVQIQHEGIVQACIGDLKTSAALLVKGLFILNMKL